jgi:hypothetical protein
MSAIKRLSALIGVYAFSYMFLVVDEAWAYVDPATTTYIIQIATAVIITLGVSLSVLLYRFRMVAVNIQVKLRAIAYALRRRRQLGATKTQAAAADGESADDKAADGKAAGAGGKAADGKAAGAMARAGQGDADGEAAIGCPMPVRENYGALAAYPEPEDLVLAPRVRRGPVHWLLHDERGFKKRLVTSLLLAAAMTMTFVIFGMLDSVIHNEAQLTFAFADIAPAVLRLAGVVFLGLALFFCLFRGRLFDIVTGLSTGLLLCVYLQSTFLNAGIGQLMGDPLEWEQLGYDAVILNLILWIAIIAASLLASLLLAARPRRLVSLAVPSLVLAVQLVALLSVLPPLSAWSEHKVGEYQSSLSWDGLCEVSDSGNVIVIVLDMLDEDFINDLLDENPNYFNSFDGFTCFTNNLTCYNTTFPSVVSTFTDVALNVDEPFEDYLDDAWSRRNFVDEIRDLGFSSSLYMDPPYTYTNADQVARIADNVGETLYGVDSQYVLYQLSRLSLLKSVPLSLKSTFWLSTSAFSGMLTVESGSQPYYADDVEFYRMIKEDKLSLEHGPGRFVYYHLNGPHYPFTLDANVRETGRTTSSSEQTKASFTIVREYLRQLKGLGAYKDATIIITGDHPTHLSDRQLSKPMLTGLFVKPKGSAGTQMETSDAPVSITNLRATCVEGAGGDPRRWGKTYMQVDESAVAMRHYYHRYSDDAARRKYLLDYRIIGDARDWDNWQLVGRTPYDKYWFN